MSTPDPVRFSLRPTPLAGLAAVERHALGDARGWLERLFCTEELEALIGRRRILQINRTQTARRGSVRGLHFQHPPHAECKLVSCLRGSVLDVAVDLRRGSPTFLHWHGELLSAGNRRSLWIPEGFAHGLQTLEDDCEMLYLHTALYSRTAEDGLDPFDPRLAIAWPEAVTEVSARDRGFAPLAADFAGIDA